MYKTRNRPSYYTALKARGSPMIWFDTDVITGMPTPLRVKA